MKNVFQLQPLAVAVSGALALAAASADAQTVDPNGAAVRGAYVGAATQEKKDAALAGLGLLVKQVRQTSGASDGVISNLGSFALGSFNESFQLKQLTGGFDTVVTRNGFATGFTLQPLPTIQAANDADLGAPGAAVTLNANILKTLASFNTARNFTIGRDGATIDTNGFNFGVSGNINSIGVLTKEGAGTLALTGNNLWYAQPQVMAGVLEGNTTSLQTSITNNATVRFNQAIDGTYNGSISTTGTGDLEKAGSGTFALTSVQTYRGNTAVLGGTLALRGYGTLASTTGLHIASGATFDINDTSVRTHNVGTLSGGGNIVLGGNFLTAGLDASTTFSGSISGLGGFSKAGSGTLTLTGDNTYSGATDIIVGTLLSWAHWRLPVRAG